MRERGTSHALINKREKVRVKIMYGLVDLTKITVIRNIRYQYAVEYSKDNRTHGSNLNSLDIHLDLHQPSWIIHVIKSSTYMSPNLCNTILIDNFGRVYYLEGTGDASIVDEVKYYSDYVYNIRISPVVTLQQLSNYQIDDIKKISTESAYIEYIGKINTTSRSLYNDLLSTLNKFYDEHTKEIFELTKDLKHANETIFKLKTDNQSDKPLATVSSDVDSLQNIIITQNAQIRKLKDELTHFIIADTAK